MMKPLLILLALSGLATGQTAGQYRIDKKNAGAGYSAQLITPAANSIWTWDGSLAPSSVLLSTVARTNAPNVFTGNQSVTGTVSASDGVFDAFSIVDGTMTFATDLYSYEGTAAASHRAALIPNDSLTIAQVDELQTTLDGKGTLAGENTWTDGNLFNSAVQFAGNLDFPITATFTYDAVAASAHRTALGLGTLATQSGTFSGTSSGTNTGDQTSIVGITGTTAQFNASLSDGDFATLAGIETLSNKTIDGQANTLTKIPVTYSNNSDFTTTSTTFVNATGLAFPVLANKKYAVCYYLLTNKTDANGLQTQFTGPASPTKINLRHASSTSALTSLVTEFLTAFSQASSTVNTVNGDGIVTNLAGGMISNGANAGTVQLQLRAVTGGTAKIYAGSWIQVTQLD